MLIEVMSEKVHKRKIQKQISKYVTVTHFCSLFVSLQTVLQRKEEEISAYQKALKNKNKNKENTEQK